jgi:two-component system, cell cycle sensor histidine kinase and response regulator CckA
MKRILVVDNDKFMLAFMEEKLSEKGYEVEMAQSGLHALDILKTFTPDVIFIDLVMPNIDGRKLCRIIRKIPRLSKTFIVVLSAIAAEEKIEVADLNADAIIAKGPLGKMAENIFFILEKPDLASSACSRGEVLGLENIGHRGITKELLSVKNHFELILNRMSEGILEVTAGGRIVYANPVGISMIGIPEQKLLGTKFTDLLSEPDARKIEDLKDDHRKQLKKKRLDSLIELNGYLVTVNCLALENDDKATSILILSDVTEQTRVQTKLKESEQKYRVMIENTGTAVVIVEDDMTISAANSEMEKLTGYSKKKIEGKMKWTALVCQEDLEKMKAYHTKRRETKERVPEEYEFRLIDRDGCKKNIFLKTNIIPGTRKSIGSLIDITSLKKSEDALKQNEEKYRSILENIAEGYFEVDLSGNFTFFNNSLSRIIGYPKDELMGMNNRGYTSPETAKKMYRVFNHVYTTGVPVKVEDFEVIRKNGDISVLELSTSLIRSSMGEPVGFRGVVRDVTGRKKAEEALLESESKFRTLFELTPQAIARTSLETGKIEDINEKFCELFKVSREEIIGKTPIELEFYSLENRQVFVDLLNETGEVQGMEMGFKAKDGSHFKTLMFARLIQMSEQAYLITIFHDITAQKKLEAQLLQAQKMEAIGTLAGGIAHNFNNLLMGIQGYASLGLLDLEQNHHVYKKLQNIERLVQSGSKLTNQLLGYARGGKYEVRSMSLNQLVQDIADTFGQTRKDIKVHQHLDDGLFGVEVDQGQMEQVLLNLFVNAADAMPTGGDLFVQSQNATHEAMAAKAYDIKPGDYVILTIRDSGIGMNKETMERIFEPFFTTKGMGRGTGLGLASVYGIIKAHGGYVDVVSDIGHGTTFEIYLPASKVPIEYKKETSEPIQKGSGTVLMVDDEEMILEVGEQLLAELGYEVIIAENGKTAIALYKKFAEKIDMVILDMIMPEMSGGETYDQLKSINPEIKVLLSTGYSINAQAMEILNRGCKGFIQKPFAMKELSQRIKEILEK